MNLPDDNPAIPPVSERETMHEGLLQRHFDVAFAAPDGIKKLRELILTLAMQGKLVPQDPNDPPASELLKAIEAEKQRLVEEGKSKMPKPLAAIKPEEVPYQLPQGWEWVRLGKVTNYNGRKNIGSDEILPNTWLLDLEDIEKDTSRVIYRAKYSERQSKSTKSIFKKGDVLYGKLRPYLNKVVVADNDGVCTTEIVPILPYSGIDSEFLKWLLKRPSFLAHVNSLMYGVKMPRLGTDDALMSIHPLPPLAEQHRIVTKIDQLMARCDELEKLRAEREQKRRAVHYAALKRLLDAASSFPRRRESSASDHSPGCADLGPRLCGGDGRESADKEAFADAWQFIARHFNELYSVKENVTELRKAILQIAVMGKLVPQDPSDPPASTLLKAIEAEKQRLVKEGKIKAAKPLPPIQPEEVPYELPQGWEWVRLGDVVLSIVGGGTPSKNNPAFWGGRIPWASVKDLNVDVYLESTIDSITENGLNNSSTNLIPKGSIIVCTRMGSGKVAINKVDISINQDLKALSISSFVDKMFFFLKYKDYKIIGKGVTVHGIRQDELLNLLFPLPPLPEQHRIVAKVDQLMGLCDTLENQIDAASNQQAALLNALMAQG